MLTLKLRRLTPLHSAVQNSQLDTVKLLVDNSADIKLLIGMVMFFAHCLPYVII